MAKAFTTSLMLVVFFLPYLLAHLTRPFSPPAERDPGLLWDISGDLVAIVGPREFSVEGFDVKELHIRDYVIFPDYRRSLREYVDWQGRHLSERGIKVEIYTQEFDDLRLYLRCRNGPTYYRYSDGRWRGVLSLYREDFLYQDLYFRAYKSRRSSVYPKVYSGSHPVHLVYEDNDGRLEYNWRIDPRRTSYLRVRYRDGSYVYVYFRGDNGFRISSYEVKGELEYQSSFRDPGRTECYYRNSFVNLLFFGPTGESFLSTGEILPVNSS